MTQRIIYILLSLFLNLFLFQRVFPEDFCESLNSKLIEIKTRKAEAEKALKQNDSGLMQAQEILLLARAKGDTKACQVAEDAIKRFEDNIAKNKKIMKECDDEISRIENMLTLCSGDECKTIKSKIERTREALKRTIKDAERQSREYEELEKRLEGLRSLQKELSSWDNRLDFVLNAIEVTGALESVRLVKKLKDSIALSVYSFGRDNVELVRALKAEGERTAKALEEARSSVEEIERDVNLTRKFLDAGLDITDLASKIMKTENVFKEAIKLNNLLKVNEYIYKTLYINLGYELFGEELSTRLYATDKTMEAVNALKKELHREMEIYKTCKELGRLNQ